MREENRNTAVLKNLQVVFGGMVLDEDYQGLNLTFQEQMLLIYKYLKNTTQGGEGGDDYDKEFEMISKKKIGCFFRYVQSVSK